MKKTTAIFTALLASIALSHADVQLRYGNIDNTDGGVAPDGWISFNGEYTDGDALTGAIGSLGTIAGAANGGQKVTDTVFGTGLSLIGIAR